LVCAKTAAEPAESPVRIRRRVTIIVHIAYRD
jgi:hypothetical protein